MQLLSFLTSPAVTAPLRSTLPDCCREMSSGPARRPAPAQSLRDTSASMLGMQAAAEAIAAADAAAANAQSAASVAQAAASLNADRSAAAASQLPAQLPGRLQALPHAAEAQQQEPRAGLVGVHSGLGGGSVTGSDSIPGHVLHELLTAALWCGHACLHWICAPACACMAGHVDIHY